MFRQYFVVPVLIISILSAGFTQAVSAAVISTREAMAVDVRAATEASVHAQLARDDVRQAMLRLGVDPIQADGRVASLSDEELLQLQGQLDELPAGGDFLAVIGIVFVVLLILELTGAIDIFKKT